MDKISILGVPVASITRQAFIKNLMDFCRGGSVKTICYVNAHCLNLACTDPEYKHILSCFDLVYAGGQAVVWASRLWGSGLPERVNVMHHFNRLTQEFKKNRIRIYLLGAGIETVQLAAARLSGKGIIVAGYHHGFFQGSREDQIIADINACKADVLILGMGAPVQEKWIYRNKDRLNVKVCWALGGFFEYAAGKRSSAPTWMVNCCLEWFYLGIQVPSRLVKRYLLGNILFVFRVLYSRLASIVYKT